ncbi:hypothetical protein SSX86_023187 [Deinandra increscens subsp. villosa]|uniref:Uncharacterized protein n=1 Tax=Deinandra increscens subsp. villosa TaxID=3103831 RepID=A0AAP0CKD4_9ASTR
MIKKKELVPYGGEGRREQRLVVGSVTREEGSVVDERDGQRLERRCSAGESAGEPSTEGGGGQLANLTIPDSPEDAQVIKHVKKKKRKNDDMDKQPNDDSDDIPLQAFAERKASSSKNRGKKRKSCVHKDVLVDPAPKISLHTMPGLKPRSSPAQFARLISILKPKQRDSIYNMGFGQLLTFKCDGIPSNIGYFVVDNFDPQEMEIKAGTSSVKVDCVSINKLLGVLMGSKSFLKSKRSKRRDPAVKDWRKRYPNKDVSPTELVDQVMSSPDEDSFNFRMDVLMCFICVMVDCSSQGIVKQKIAKKVYSDIDCFVCEGMDIDEDKNAISFWNMDNLQEWLSETSKNIDCLLSAIESADTFIHASEDASDDEDKEELHDSGDDAYDGEDHHTDVQRSESDDDTDSGNDGDEKEHSDHNVNEGNDPHDEETNESGDEDTSEQEDNGSDGEENRLANLTIPDSPEDAQVIKHVKIKRLASSSKNRGKKRKACVHKDVLVDPAPKISSHTMPGLKTRSSPAQFASFVCEGMDIDEDKNAISFLNMDNLQVRQKMEARDCGFGRGEKKELSEVVDDGTSVLVKYGLFVSLSSDDSSSEDASDASEDASDDEDKEELHDSGDDANDGEDHHSDVQKSESDDDTDSGNDGDEKEHSDHNENEGNDPHDEETNESGDEDTSEQEDNGSDGEESESQQSTKSGTEDSQSEEQSKSGDPTHDEEPNDSGEEESDDEEDIELDVEKKDEEVQSDEESKSGDESSESEEESNSENNAYDHHGSILFQTPISDYKGSGANDLSNEEANVSNHEDTQSEEHPRSANEDSHIHEPNQSQEFMPQTVDIQTDQSHVCQPVIDDVIQAGEKSAVQPESVVVHNETVENEKLEINTDEQCARVDSVATTNDVEKSNVGGSNVHEGSPILFDTTVQAEPNVIISDVLKDINTPSEDIFIEPNLASDTYGFSLGVSQIPLPVDSPVIDDNSTTTSYSNAIIPIVDLGKFFFIK